MPAVSKKQQRYFGYLLSNPEERKKKGISKKAAKDFAQDIQEVSPPGWGHTKAEKEKTKPWKPKSKIGGSAAAFKRALDDGRFKGLPGSKTKKEKTADMFKLMWAMKKKGDKPHYKPGTDKKYKKYQKEETAMQDNNLYGDAYAGLKKKIGSKKKHNKPAFKEGVAFKDFCVEASAAWQRKEGKNKEGGLNEKGRKSYERENPGSDLKAPQPEGGSRKKSFCARMGGMKKKLTSSKTANDPDSRINKALRKWKC